MSLRDRFLALQDILAAHESVWRPAPFRVRRPDWCADRPALADAALALDDATVERFADDPEACRAWLAPQLPAVDTVAALCELPRLPARALPPWDAHLDGSIPGRKRAQIEAFVAHAGMARTPVLEWCAGKGHLGRRVAVADGVPVRSLEIDPTLCAEAERLATRAGVDQTVLRGDALDPATQSQAHGHAVFALHACGELHRTLVRGAEAAGAHGYRIAPCCYHLGAAEAYRPLSAEAALALDADTLRLAVTETVTAPRHDRRRLVRDQAWKLGFLALRDALEGEAPRHFRPVPAHWLASDFATFGRALAARDGVRLPTAVDWAHWLDVGERRRAEVRRLELVRHAFRRPIETWLVLDLALALEAAGFHVHAGPFCKRTLTPRNLMIVADRQNSVTS